MHSFRTYRISLFQWWHVDRWYRKRENVRNGKISEQRVKGDSGRERGDDRKIREQEERCYEQDLQAGSDTLCLLSRADTKDTEVEREINNTSYHKEMQFIYHTDKLWRKPTRYEKRVQKLMIDTRVRRRSTLRWQGSSAADVRPFYLLFSNIGFKKLSAKKH